MPCSQKVCNEARQGLLHSAAPYSWAGAHYCTTAPWTEPFLGGGHAWLLPQPCCKTPRSLVLAWHSPGSYPPSSSPIPPLPPQGPTWDQCNIQSSHRVWLRPWSREVLEPIPDPARLSWERQVGFSCICAIAPAGSSTIFIS